MIKKSALHLGVGLGAVALTLAACGCGGGATESSSAPAETSAIPGGGGSAECSDSALTTPSTEAGTAGGFGILGDGTTAPAGTAVDAASVRSKCDGGWAVVFANATPPGAQSTAVVFLFEAEGQFWVPKTVADVCGGSDIPEALSAAACQFVK
ncbi:MAG: hypothetical protein ACKOT0_01850 [bacterium]